MTIKLPALIPDRNSASGFRVEFLDAEIDADLAKKLSIDDEDEPSPEARRMLRVAHELRGADLERCGQIAWADKEKILQALHIAAKLLK